MSEEYLADTDIHIGTEDKVHEITRNFQGKRFKTIALLGPENSLNEKNELGSKNDKY